MMQRAGKIFFVFWFLASFLGGVGQGWAQEYGGGPIVFIKPVRAVIFEHKVHLGKKFTCEDCHPHIFPKKAGEVEGREDFTMESFNQGKYCGSCHDSTTAFSVNTKCTLCHIGVQGHKRLEEYQLGIK